MGEHTISVEVDLMRLETRGLFSVTEVDQLHQRIAGVLREHGGAYLLVDARGGLSFDSTMRRQVAQLKVVFAPTAVAIFGATLPQQAMLMLLSSAMQLVRGKRLPLRFSRSETEAHAWLLTQRPLPAA